MNILSEMAGAYLRWRHSHGYGVHSPFAYRFVEQAVRPGRGYSFYGYADIDASLTGFKGSAYGRTRHDARLLLRCAAFLRAGRVLMGPSAPAVFSVAARGAGARSETWKSRHPAPPKPGDILVTGPSWRAPEEISRRLAAGTTVIAFDPAPEAWAEMMAFTAPGLLLHGRRIIMAIPNPAMAFTTYAMAF